MHIYKQLYYVEIEGLMEQDLYCGNIQYIVW